MFKFFVTFFILLICYDLQAVDGASCKTDSSCQDTDYTSDICLLGVCLCINSSYTPVRTGCALKLDKPVIYAEPVYSNEVISGHVFRLICNVFDAASFEWYLGATKLASNTVIHAAVAFTSSVGSFYCRGITLDGVLRSELSDPFQVQLLGSGGLTTSSVRPRVVVPTAQIVSGASLELSCINIPLGYNGSISYTVNGVITSNPIVRVDSSNAGKDVQCTIANGAGYTFSTPTSATAKLPTLTSIIRNVSVTFNGRLYTEVGKPSGAASILTCQLTPDSLYLGGSSAVTYVWLNYNLPISGATGATFAATDPGVYYCTARLGSQGSVVANNTIIVYNSDDVLVSSTRRPIRGGRVILTCGRTPGKNLVIYRWLKDGRYIGRQYDQRLQLDNFDSSDDGTYECEILSTTIFFETIGIRLQTQTSLDKPFVYDDVCGSRYGERGDYRLACGSSSETIGMTYEWTVNGLVSPVTSKYYYLPVITRANNGVYACRTKFGTYTSPYSDGKSVAVTDPGLICYHDYTCVAARTGYTGKCDKDMMCKCSYGYTRRGEVCSDAILTATSSTVIIAMAYFASRIF